MTAYEKVKAARDPARPTATDYINSIFAAFTEMHGDRRYSDDGAVVTGLALLGSMPVTVIGLEKGHDIKERVARNFGCAHPEGYRKALRQMKLAEKFRRPIVCFVDTSGAYCGIGAEERGQAQAIAENLYEMSALKTPILSVFIGEGGSGKSTVAARLAEKLDRIALDSDAEIEEKNGMSCAQLIEKHGEAELRELESEAIAALGKR